MPRSLRALHYFEYTHYTLARCQLHLTSISSPGLGCLPQRRDVPSPNPCPCKVRGPASSRPGTHRPHRLRTAIKHVYWCLRLWCFLEPRLAIFNAMSWPPTVLQRMHNSIVTLKMLMQTPQQSDRQP
jgi:hypothetical protein